MITKIIQEFKLKSFKKKSGKLIPIEFKKNFRMRAKRIFYIYGNKNKRRGDHAHKKCSQIFIPILGKTELKIKSLTMSKKIILNHKKSTAVLIPPKYWCGLNFINSNTIVMVICDYNYDFNDYIEKFSEYKKYMKRNK